MTRSIFYVPCMCGCGVRIDITDRWHFVNQYGGRGWFAGCECLPDYATA